jgi:hypothetical protein
MSRVRTGAGGFWQMLFSAHHCGVGIGKQYDSTAFLIRMMAKPIY